MAKQPNAGPEAAKAAPTAIEPDPRDAMTVKQLAQAVLGGEVRPRAADIRRLAQEVLKPRKSKPEKPRKGSKKGKKKHSGKLPKIP